VACEDRLQNGSTTPPTFVNAAKATTRLAFAVYTPLLMGAVVEPLLQICDLGSSLRLLVGVLAEAVLDAVTVVVDVSTAF
jgi:hypothetical protein